MRRLDRQIFFTLLLLLCYQGIQAQAVKTAGSLAVSGKAKSGSTVVTFKRKRFYLFHGGREANKNLIDRLKAADMPSPDCFYCRLKASPEFMAWLKNGDCESVHCREITTEDIAKVPEFQAAHRKGLGQFKLKPALAQKWLVTNLAPGFRSGFYGARRAFVKEFQKDIIQTAMTDSGRDPKGYFTNIPLSGKVEKFVYTNLVPIEIGEKSYVWICEAEVGKDKTTPVLDTDTGKLSKKCEVVVRSLPVCNAGVCEQK